MPAFKFPPNKLETNPTKEGPAAQPISPANAKSANMAVPPCEQLFADKLKTPGHKIPTENPHIPQPIKESRGNGEKTANK